MIGNLKFIMKDIRMNINTQKKMLKNLLILGNIEDKKSKIVNHFGCLCYTKF